MKLNHSDSFSLDHLSIMLNAISSISRRFGGALYVSGLMSHVRDLLASKVRALSISI